MTFESIVVENSIHVKMCTTSNFHWNKLSICESGENRTKRHRS